MNSEELLASLAGVTEENDDGTDSTQDSSESSGEETIMNNTDDVVIPENEDGSDSESTLEEDGYSVEESE